MTIRSKQLMKKFSSLLGLAVAFSFIYFFSGCATAGGYDNQSSSDSYTDNNSYQDEQEVLDRYGEWITVPEYGMVWRPFVASDWQPYYYGNWIRTENGWTWVSYEPFGWIVYHYGYWDFRPEIGWFWIESNDWSPARVEWAYNGDYVGWAPLPPPGENLPSPGVSQVNVWNIVQINNFTQDNIGKYRLRRTPEGFRNNVRLHVAPDISTVERYTNRQVRIVRPNRERINVHGRQFDRMVLPDREAATVRRYEPQVRRDVVRTRDDVQRNNDKRNDNTQAVPPPPPPPSLPATRSNDGTRNNSGTRNNEGTRNNNNNTNRSGENNRDNTVRDNNRARTQGGNNTTVTPPPENKTVRPIEPERNGNRVVKPAEPKNDNNNNRTVRPAEPRVVTPVAPTKNPNEPNRGAVRQQQQPQQPQRNRERERNNDQKKTPEVERNTGDRQQKDKDAKPEKQSTEETK